MSIISFVILDVLCSLSTQQRYKQSALRIKELIAFFGEYFTFSEICSANQWTGFYMTSASVMKGLIEYSHISQAILLQLSNFVTPIILM